MSYRDDLAALSARHDALEREVEHKTRELEHAASLLAEAKARIDLPVLDNLRVASPCRADWATMQGDERVRRCGACSQNVYNISDMTRDEAEALILGRTGRLCIRYYRRADGTVLTKDCAVGVKRRRRRRVVMLGAAAMLATGAAVTYEELTSTPAAEPEHVMGQMKPTLGKYEGAGPTHGDFK
jgi:hypothetical protein